MPESEIDFPKFVAWSFGSSKHSKHHVPHTKMGFGSGIWTLAPRDLCFAQDIEPEPVSPYTVPDFKTKKTSFAERTCRNITAPCNEPCTHLLDSPHCTMRHPVAAHAACAYSDLQGSVHIHRICAYLPKLSPNFVDNRHPQALSAPSCRYQPPVASRALP